MLPNVLPKSHLNVLHMPKSRIRKCAKKKKNGETRNLPYSAETIDKKLEHSLMRCAALEYPIRPRHSTHEEESEDIDEPREIVLRGIMRVNRLF